MDWDARYAGSDYLFGTEPAAALVAHGGVFAPQSRILSVADGEGRNSAWLARQEHIVTAFEPSKNARAKARSLHDALGVSVALEDADIASFAWPPEAFDAVAGIFIQFAPPDERSALFAAMAQSLKPGGILFLHGYAPRQVEYGTGGPPFSDNMYTLPMLHAAYPGWEILREADYDADVAEGTGHVGRSALIDFIARKPS